MKGNKRNRFRYIASQRCIGPSVQPGLAFRYALASLLKCHGAGPPWLFCSDATALTFTPKSQAMRAEIASDARRCVQAMRADVWR
eukprot:3002472-Pleurochrysis_carterae.AAC.5